MHALTTLIYQDMKPALGVTEPGAIAFAVASSRKELSGNVEKIEVQLNSGMFKNAYTCGIPNSKHYGNVYAAALGAIAANPKLGLKSLADITEEDNEKAEKFVSDGRVQVTLDHIGSEISIKATVWTEEGYCSVCIEGSHTDIRWIQKNDKIIYEKENAHPDEQSEEEQVTAEIHRYTFKEILNYVIEIGIEEISFIEEAYQMNLELLKEGMKSDRTTILHMLYRENGEAIISRDEKKTAQLLCNGAIEARVLGLNKPAMSITGSGAHGIIASMPLYALYEADRLKKEALIRGTALSYLITMYIKEYSGKLSAFCGCGIAAGTGMACGLGLMKGADEEALVMVIQNMAAGLTGMICDGGNQGCAMKGIVAVDAAFRAVDMALNNVCIESIHGIVGGTPEQTMKNMGLIASPGMVKTEETIVEIMQSKY